MACNSRCAGSERPASTCRCRCNKKNHGRDHRVRSTGVVGSPSNVRAAIRDFLHGIEPAERDLERIERHKKGITDALEEAKFPIVRVFQTGSHARGTAVKGMSDADYFVVLRRSEIKNGESLRPSNEVLNDVKNALRQNYERTDVVRDGQAVVVDFSDSSADVVPAVWNDTIGEDDGRPVFIIPDGENGWMRTSPEALSSFIQQADTRSGGKLKHGARGIKKWRGREPEMIPLKSLYIEMVLAQSRCCDGVKPYTVLLRDAFRALADLKGSSLEDPDAISDPIRSTVGEARRSTVITKLEEAARDAALAVEAEEAGRDEHAQEIWSRIFGGGIG